MTTIEVAISTRGIAETTIEGARAAVQGAMGLDNVTLEAIDAEYGIWNLEVSDAIAFELTDCGYIEFSANDSTVWAEMP